MPGENVAPVDYSLDEYRELLTVKGRCTLGNKTVYRTYVYTTEFAKRKNYCGLYLVEEAAELCEAPEYCRLTKFPITYIELVLGRIFDVMPRMLVTELVLCDMYRCYPTPLGLYPLYRLLESQASIALRRDIILEFMRRFESINVIDYILYKTPAKVFYLSIFHPRNKTKIIVFIPTPDPDHHALNVSKLQLLTKKLIPQIDTLLATNLESANEDGLEALGLDHEKLLELAKQFFSPSNRED